MRDPVFEDDASVSAIVKLIHELSASTTGGENLSTAIDRNNGDDLVLSMSEHRSDRVMLGTKA